MAVHRLSVVVEPPAVLLSFDPADWGSADADTAFLEWQRARREFAAEYPGSSLGDILDLLRGERKARREHWCDNSPNFGELS